MKVGLIFLVLFFGPWFVLPPFLAFVVGFGLGMPFIIWMTSRDAFPFRRTSDEMGSDPAETERNHLDNLNRWTAKVHRLIR